MWHIDCNKTFKRLEAETWEEAEKEVTTICGEYSEPGIVNARILEVTEAKNFDVAGWKEERRKKRAEKKAADELAKKKALLAQLKQELGNNVPSWNRRRQWKCPSKRSNSCSAMLSIWVITTQTNLSRI